MRSTEKLHHSGVGPAVRSASSPPSPGSSGAAEPGSDYLQTEAHYLAVAGRILAVLQRGRFVLLTGDWLSPSSMTTALRQAAEGRFVVVELAPGQMLADSHRKGAAPPLFILAEADRVADAQIGRICAAIAQGAEAGMAAVLLARPDFVDRLDAPSLRDLHGAIAARLRFDELGDNEAIDFLRHQLETRPRNGEQRARGPILLWAVAGLGIALVAGAGAWLAMQGADVAGRLGAGARPTVSASPAAKPRPAAAPPAAGGPPPAPAAPPAVGGPPPAPAAAAPSPPAARQFSAAEIAALAARGDAALSAGDIASARLFYERAAEAGDGAAALRLGATYDPGFLGRAGIRGPAGDPAQAALWYRRARDLGEAGAAERLKNLAPPH